MNLGKVDGMKTDGVMAADMRLQTRVMEWFDRAGAGWRRFIDAPDQTVTFRKATLVSIGLLALFMFVYSAINSFTAHRTDVGELYFEWERMIPFVPLLILPYMSIDLLFAIAPFMCKTDDELEVFARRVVFVVLVAGVCYLLFPLRYAFPRPAVHGWQGLLFGILGKCDDPYNLLPSQHITLRTILAATYARHLKGKWRVASHIWFSLIGLSTVLVYQHHILDVVFGFIVVWYGFYLFPSQPQSQEIAFAPNYRIGLYYVGGFAAIAALIFCTGPWGALLLWPASSLLIAATGHFKFGERIYRKRNGKIALETWLALGPVLAGQLIVQSLQWVISRRNDAVEAILPTLRELKACRLVLLESRVRLCRVGATIPTNSRAD